MQADFVATVSHELRAPLARIQGYVDSLTHLALTADQQRRFIGDIGHATAQLTRLVETILSFSQVEEGRLTPVARPTDVAAIVGRAMDDLAPADRSRLQLDVPPIAVLADPQRLGQVMDNLIANALKYSPADAAVQVRAQARPAAGTAWLSVRDQGQGVPPDDRPYLFSKFFRARTVRESSVPGTGLGLYLCKRLIEAQGGTIRLRSRTGSGTIVRILLPLA
jgi:signal transduction histidine kinase